MSVETFSKWRVFFSVSIIGFFLDLLSKHLVVLHLKLGVPVKVIGEYAQLLLVYNKAAVFGLDPRKLFPSFPLNGFFFVFTILAIVLVIVYFNALKEKDSFMRWGITLVMPGALGNLFDRIVHPNLGVVDFVRLGVSETLYWPIFNVADIWVTFGVILICVGFLLEGKTRKEHAEGAHNIRTVQ